MELAILIFIYYWLQPGDLPLEVMKAAVLFRKRLRLVWLDNADVVVLKELAAVCRHWWKTMKTGNKICRRQLRRHFHR